MKRLIFLISLVMMLSVFSVVSEVDDQGVQVDVNGVVSFSVSDLNLGQVSPPDTASGSFNLILNEENNDDLNFLVTVSEAGSGGLLNEVTLDLIQFGETANERVGDSPTFTVIDPASAQTFTIPASLIVPSGFSAGLVQGVFTYTGTGPSP